MAINWEVSISNVKVQQKRADVQFIRTDTESVLAPMTFSYQNTIIAGDTPTETNAIRQALLDTIKAEVVKQEEQEVTIDELVTNLEQVGKSALETWEVTR